MKIFVGYSIWCQQDMLSYLLEGIVDNFDPDKTELGFVFTKPENPAFDAFNCMHYFWLTERGFKFVPNQPKPHDTKSFKFMAIKADHDLTECGGHNVLLRYFMEQTDCDVMLAPQDDTRFLQPVHQELETVLKRYGDKIGLIGSRDGFSTLGFRDAASSFWSNSNPPPKIYLKHGECAERTLFNSGPVTYPRTTVQKVGYLDELFTAWNIWVDYGWRCKKAGLTSVSMGMNVRHYKFGRQDQSWIYDSVDGVVCGYTAKDNRYLLQKHPDLMHT